MNTTRKERFIQKATRLTVKVLLFSLLLSLFLYAGVGTDSALIPDDFSAEQSIAQAANAPQQDGAQTWGTVVAINGDSGELNYADFGFTTEKSDKTWTYTETFSSVAFSSSNVQAYKSNGNTQLYIDDSTGYVKVGVSNAVDAAVVVGVININPGSFITDTILSYSGAKVTAAVSVTVTKDGYTNNKFFNVYTSKSGITATACGASNAESVKANSDAFNDTSPQNVSKTVTLSASEPIIGIAFGTGWPWWALDKNRNAKLSNISVTYTIEMPNIPVTFAKNGNGTISHTGSQTIGDSGIAFTATPAEGYHFNGITKKAYGSGATSTDLAASPSIICNQAQKTQLQTY